MNALLRFLAAFLGRLQRPTAANAAPLTEVLTHEAQSLPETLARIAESQLGVLEESGNRGAMVQEYQSATWLTGTGWKWCAAFVCWCVWQTMQALGLKPVSWVRPRTAGAWDFENWAEGKEGHAFNGDWKCFPSTPENPPRRGDIMTFTWSHIGIVTSYDSKTKTIFTVEGNTSVGLGREGVGAKKHHVTKCRRLIRYVR